MNNKYIEKEVTVAELKDLYNSNEYEINISTPDGYQLVTDWFDKGLMDMYTVTTESGKITRCAYNHAIQSSDDNWIFAENIQIGDMIKTVDGDEQVINITKNDTKEECFDFTVNHPNHRYYGDGIVSHNSGKSLIVSGNVVRNAQQQGILPVIFDSENALDDDWLQALGVDTSPDKLMKFNVSLINDVASIMNAFIKNYRATDPEERPKILFVIDSLGMMTTPVEQNQFEAGNMKGDMGHKPKQLASLVRNLVVQIADLNIGVVTTNHTYASQDMFDPDDKVSGGQGFVYASSIVVATKKLKLKENEEGQKITEVDGVKAACKIMKSRYGKAFETCKLNIRFDKGLEPYSGLFDYWERLGVLTKVGNRYKYICNDGSEILEFRKNLKAEHYQRIMEEWDYNKYKLKSDARLNNTEEELSEEELSEEELHKISDEFLNSEDTAED